MTSKYKFIWICNALLNENFYIKLHVVGILMIQSQLGINAILFTLLFMIDVMSWYDTISERLNISKFIVYTFQYSNKIYPWQELLTNNS